MNTVEHNGFLFVEVPNGSYEHSVFDNAIFFTKPDGEITYIKEFKVGNYSIVGLAKDLTEEQWKEVVDEKQVVCPEYGQKHMMPINYETKKMAASYTKSGLSLLKSHSLELATTLILKKL